MSTPAEERADAYPNTAKNRAKREELAKAAMHTLAQRGYANTGLRDISRNSPYSHGIVHYYFADKTDLITECVRLFKAECIQRYDAIAIEADTARELRSAFAQAMSETMIQHAEMHRLWYDLRTQCMFDRTFADDVAAIDKSLERMVWRTVRRYAALLNRKPTVTPTYAYRVVDGIFQHSLARHLADDKNAAAQLRKQLRTAIDQIVAL